MGCDNAIENKNVYFAQAGFNQAWHSAFFDKRDSYLFE